MHKTHTCILFHTPTCMQQTKTWHYTNTHVIICNTQSNIFCVGLLRKNNNLTWHTQMVMTHTKLTRHDQQIVITSHNIPLARPTHATLQVTHKSNVTRVSCMSHTCTLSGLTCAHMLPYCIYVQIIHALLTYNDPQLCVLLQNGSLCR